MDLIVGRGQYRKAHWSTEVAGPIDIDSSTELYLSGSLVGLREWPRMEGHYYEGSSRYLSLSWLFQCSSVAGHKLQIKIEVSSNLPEEPAFY